MAAGRGISKMQWLPFLADLCRAKPRVTTRQGRTHTKAVVIWDYSGIEPGAFSVPANVPAIIFGQWFDSYARQKTRGCKRAYTSFCGTQLKKRCHAQLCSSAGLNDRD
jgi:hypothetical protein